jgi:hypothetical protein
LFKQVAPGKNRLIYVWGHLTAIHDAWVGVSTLFLPNLIWQMQHHFIEFLSHLHARDLGQGLYRGFYREQLWICVNLVTAPLISWACVGEETRGYRFAACRSVFTVRLG